jgi:hypothetical protein
MDHRSVLDLPLIHLDHTRRYRTSVHKRFMRDRSHRVSHVLIDVVNPGHVGRVVVDDRGVINVGHLSHAHSRVGDVHVIHVTGAGSIPGHVNFAWSQREPSHTGADTNPHAETASADKRD